MEPTDYVPPYPFHSKMETVAVSEMLVVFQNTEIYRDHNPLEITY
jgi:hypothetical protein